MTSTGNAGGNHNLLVSHGHEDLPALLRRMHRGLLVTELLGQGVNPVTGDYSRGAAGFWVEGGEIAYPVEEITIAGNLARMYRDIVAIGKDVDRRGSRQCGSIPIGLMTVGGTRNPAGPNGRKRSPVSCCGDGAAAARSAARWARGECWIASLPWGDASQSVARGVDLVASSGRTAEHRPGAGGHCCASTRA
jgi:hypothetical protein